MLEEACQGCIVFVKSVETAICNVTGYKQHLHLHNYGKYETTSIVANTKDI